MKLSSLKHPSYRPFLFIGILAMLIALSVAPAIAQVSTDKEDYSPGEVVTISGDNEGLSEPWAEGTAVTVDVAGPNGWSKTVGTTVGEDGSWSVSFALSSDPAIAVGDYTYVASAEGYAETQTGAFTDGQMRVVASPSAAQGGGFRIQGGAVDEYGVTDYNRNLANGSTYTVSEIQSPFNNATARWAYTGPSTHTGTVPNAGYTVTLTYTAVNYAPTNISLSPSSVNEGLPVGTEVGTFTTTDVDDTVFTYALVSGSGSAQNGSFTISGDKLLTSAVFDVAADTTYNIRVRTTDSVGLWYEKHLQVTVSNVAAGDTDPPTTSISLNPVTPDGNNGWYKQNVVVTLTPDEPATTYYNLNAGGWTTYSAPFTISTEGENSLEYYSVDTASNEETPHPTATIKIDKTPPEVSFNPAGPGTFVLGATASAHWEASDDHSGIDGATSGDITLDTATVGNKSVTKSVFDVAGWESTTVTYNYSVGYDFGGFLPPIDNGTSVFKAGRTIPVKFVLKDADENLITDGVIATFGYLRYAPGITGMDEAEPLGDGEAAPTGGTMFRYDPVAEQWIYNWSTKGLAVPYKYAIVVKFYAADDSNPFQTAAVLVGLSK